MKINDRGMVEFENGAKRSRLIYNDDADRYELDGDGLHCGDCIEVLLPDGWTATRVEYEWNTHNWCLVGLTGVQLDGLIARR